MERLTDLVTRSRHLPAKDMVDFILKELQRFQGKAEQHDDMTALTLVIPDAP